MNADKIASGGFIFPAIYAKNDEEELDLNMLSKIVGND